MLPLIIPKRVNSLRYFSSVGVLCIFYFIVCIIIHAVTHGMRDKTRQNSIVYVRADNDALQGLGIFMFSFMCQLNAFEIYHEMRTKSVFNFTLYAAFSMTCCATLYILAGYFGYADFGSKVKDSILALYDPLN
uniref:Amino acid transporter transmembrane domain-containing protein n=1 Tax=Lygus hesperus TaxID=30085 RepID=A0A0A9W3V2_LYGHE